MLLTCAVIPICFAMLFNCGFISVFLLSESLCLGTPRHDFMLLTVSIYHDDSVVVPECRLAAY